MSRKTPAREHELLTPAELASRWKGHVSDGTLRNWRSQRRGPPFLKVAGGRIRYRLVDVITFETTTPMRRSPTAASDTTTP
jgi:hypothetical protein